MTETQKFDLIVVGTGVAGSTIAYKARSAGWNVAIIDSRPFGGTCELRGCDPKKVLAGLADVVDWHNRMRGKGASRDELKVDWPDLMKFKRTFIDPVPEEREKGFVEAGISVFHERAHFEGKTTLQAGNDLLTGRYIAIASGAKPVDLAIPGKEHLTTSDQFMELDELPREVVFVGGGYVSFEFAHIAARTGAKVTILEVHPQPLRQFDPDLVGMLVKASRDAGIDVQLNTKVEKIEMKNGRLSVHTSGENGQHTYEAGLVVHGAGRVPEIDDLQVDKGGVDREKKGITVNEYLQSVSNPAVYAAGDSAASAGLPLTPVATAEGRIAAANILTGNHRKASYGAIPSTVFSIPPLASVGLLEEEARKQGIQFETNFSETSSWYASRRINEPYSGYKVLVDEASQRVLGAHILGSHAEEIINIFALAIQTGVTTDTLKEMIYSYPTSASNISYMV